MELFSSNLKDWNVEEGKNGVAKLVYKDTNVFANNIPQNLTKTGIKETLAYVKDVKSQAAQAATEAMTSYLSQNKGVEKAVAVVQSGLNSSDNLYITLTREKSVRIPGTDKTKKISPVVVSDKSHSHHVSKSFIKNLAVQAAEKLVK